MVSSRLVANVDILWKRARPRTERASERGSASIIRIERSWIPSLLPPPVPVGRHSARRGKNSHSDDGRRTKEGGQKRLAPSGPGPTYSCARFPLSLSEVSVCFFCFSSAEAGWLAGLSARTGCVQGDTDARQPANLVPRPKPYFFSASASILVSTLRCAMPSGEYTAEGERWPVRDADARTYALGHTYTLTSLTSRAAAAAAAAAAADTTERPEILGDSAGQVTGQVSSMRPEVDEAGWEDGRVWESAFSLSLVSRIATMLVWLSSPGRTRIRRQGGTGRDSRFLRLCLPCCCWRGRAGRKSGSLRALSLTVCQEGNSAICQLCLQCRANPNHTGLCWGASGAHRRRPWTRDDGLGSGKGKVHRLLLGLDMASGGCIHIAPSLQRGVEGGGKERRERQAFSHQVWRSHEGTWYIKPWWWWWASCRGRRMVVCTVTPGPLSPRQVLWQEQ